MRAGGGGGGGWHGRRTGMPECPIPMCAPVRGTSDVRHLTEVKWCRDPRSPYSVPLVPLVWPLKRTRRAGRPECFSGRVFVDRAETRVFPGPRRRQSCGMTTAKRVGPSHCTACLGDGSARRSRPVSTEAPLSLAVAVAAAVGWIATPARTLRPCQPSSPPAVRLLTSVTPAALPSGTTPIPGPSATSACPTKGPRPGTTSWKG